MKHSKDICLAATNNEIIAFQILKAFEAIM